VKRRFGEKPLHPLFLTFSFSFPHFLFIFSSLSLFLFLAFSVFFPYLFLFFLLSLSLFLTFSFCFSFSFPHFLFFLAFSPSLSFSNSLSDSYVFLCLSPLDDLSISSFLVPSSFSLPISLFPPSPFFVSVVLHLSSFSICLFIFIFTILSPFFPCSTQFYYLLLKHPEKGNLPQSLQHKSWTHAISCQSWFHNQFDSAMAKQPAAKHQINGQKDLK